MVIVAAVERPDQSNLVAEGAALAAAFGEELHVLNVATPPAFPDDIGPSVEDPDAREQIEDAAAGIAAEAAAEVAPDATAVGRIGEDAAGAVVAYAEEQDARYLVVGGRRRTPVGKVIFGSVTQSVLLHADRPVLAVMDEE